MLQRWRTLARLVALIALSFVPWTKSEAKPKANPHPQGLPKGKTPTPKDTSQGDVNQKKPLQQLRKNPAPKEARAGKWSLARPFSLALYAPSQLCERIQPLGAVSLEYRMGTFHGASAQSSHVEESYGPYQHFFALVPQARLPLVLGLFASLGREKGHTTSSGRSGDTTWRENRSGLALIHALNRRLAVAAELQIGTRRLAGTYYDDAHYFAWQEYQLSLLLREDLWEAGLQFRPGLLQVGHRQDELQSLSLGLPPRWQIHGSYQLDQRSLAFASLEYLLHSYLNHARDGSFRNQILAHLGLAVRGAAVIYEAALTLSSDGLRTVERGAGHRLGQTLLQVSLAKPFRHHGQWGLRMQFGAGTSQLAGAKDEWTVSANAKAVSGFMSWTFATTPVKSAT